MRLTHIRCNYYGLNITELIFQMVIDLTWLLKFSASVLCSRHYFISVKIRTLSYGLKILTEVVLVMYPVWTELGGIWCVSVGHLMLLLCLQHLIAHNIILFSSAGGLKIDCRWWDALCVSEINLTLLTQGLDRVVRSIISPSFSFRMLKYTQS